MQYFTQIVDSRDMRQIFYVIGVAATIYIAVTIVLPVLLKLTGWILGVVITAVIFAALIAAILYSISKLAEMLRK